MNDSKDINLPIKYDPAYKVVTANDLIRGQQKMTLREAQLFAITISQVVKEDKDLKTYTTTVPELAGFMGIDENSLYRDLESICSALLRRIVKLPKIGNSGKRDRKNGWTIFHLLNSATYEKGILTLRLSDDIKPFVIDLNRNYSQPLLGTLMSFRSYYTMRLYQYLLSEYKQYGKDEWSFSCEELRELFQTYVKDEIGNILKERYVLNRDLLRYTIIPALSELHRSDFAFIYNYKELTERKAGSRGRPSIAGVRFGVIFFEDKVRKDLALARMDFIKANSQQTIIPFGDEQHAHK